MKRKIGEVFIDGRMVNLDNLSIDMLESTLRSVRENRINKLKNIAELVNELQD